MVGNLVGVGRLVVVGSLVEVGSLVAEDCIHIAVHLKECLTFNVIDESAIINNEISIEDSCMSMNQSNESHTLIALALLVGHFPRLFKFCSSLKDVGCKQLSLS